MAALGATLVDTATHCWDVATYSSSICAEMAVSEGARATIVCAARVHDIGKMAVPLELLERPDPLDEEERAIVRSHAPVGEQILRAFPGLDDLALLVRHSHEHWDGSGYPDGLVEEEIPFGSRVILCADAFSVITTGRPYRDAQSPAEALEELAANAGSQFDPSVVAAMVRVVKTRNLKRPLTTADSR